MSHTVQCVLLENVAALIGCPPELIYWWKVQSASTACKGHISPLWVGASLLNTQLAIYLLCRLEEKQRGADAFLCHHVLQ